VNRGKKAVQIGSGGGTNWVRRGYKLGQEGVQIGSRKVKRGWNKIDITLPHVFCPKGGSLTACELISSGS
jgi:hypothetical protein